MTSCSPMRGVQQVEIGDEQLALAARADACHFAAIYERYADRLYRYALQRTGSSATADDVVSQTMIDAMESIARFDPARGSLAAWLFTIARHRCTDHLRARNRLWRLLTRMRSHRPVAAEQVTSVATDEALDVRDALSRLSAIDREVLLLRYSADLSTVQIAEVLDISHGAARVRLTRARGRLKQELELEHE